MTVMYTPEHEWIGIENDETATIGITVHAQDALGEIVFVELPELDQVYAKGDAAGVVESVKAASDIFMPVSGRVVAVNKALQDNPSLINTDPMGDGWFFKVMVSDRAEFDALLDESAYQKLLEQES